VWKDGVADVLISKWVRSTSYNMCIVISCQSCAVNFMYNTLLTVRGYTNCLEFEFVQWRSQL